MFQYALSFKNISLSLDGMKSVFENLSCSFSKGKSGLVGRNGIGKSTLLRLASGVYTPSSGHVQKKGKLLYCAQQNGVLSSESVSSWLGIVEILEALDRIESGELEEGDLERVQDKWALKSELLAMMEDYGLSHIGLETPVSQLSGGELTRLQLAYAFASQPEILLLDEPSNNLDTKSRRQLYTDIKEFKGILLVASHDRELLEHMDRIYELNTLGLSEYGGCYSFYEQEKKKQVEAAQSQLHARIGELSQAKSQIQKRREIHEQGEAKGRRTKKEMIQAKGRTDKIALKSAKGRSERTNKRIRNQASRKLEQLNHELAEAREKIEHKYKFEISLPATKVPTNKQVLKVENLNFSYEESRPLFKNFNMSIYGPERVALEGANGSGKSTLIRLLLGEKKFQGSSCEIKVDRVSYLDQKTASLESDLTVLENFKRHNSEMPSAQVFQVLAFFLFRKEILQQKVRTLSGGERVRLLLACILMREEPPQLLILDEPTNHLDIESIECIEKALKQFEGAILVVSHDREFLRNIRVSRSILLKN